MEFIELIIIIAILVTFSNIVSKILPSVPIFFIQIILGILLGLTEMGQEIAFEPEMFLGDDHWTAIVSRRRTSRCSGNLEEQ